MQSKPSPHSGNQGYIEGAKPAAVNISQDFVLFEKMPRYVRDALREALYEFSSSDVWGAYHQARHQSDSDGEAWYLVLEMLELNVEELRRKERKIYNDLVTDYKTRRDDRIRGIQLK